MTYVVFNGGMCGQIANIQWTRYKKQSTTAQAGNKSPAEPKHDATAILGVLCDLPSTKYAAEARDKGEADADVHGSNMKLRSYSWRLKKHRHQQGPQEPEKNLEHFKEGVEEGRQILR